MNLIVNDPGQDMLALQVDDRGSGRDRSRPDPFNTVADDQDILFRDSAFIDNAGVC
jgi:hypothetical protein